ncbi:MAG: hypothetical protein IKT98_03980 [Selenomonadaceae bacterium]|nr:hypothetical protein [Selenomonadaceae bacterium]
MANNFRPSQPFSVPLLLLTPTYTKTGGVRTKTFDVANSALIYGSFKTYGGTEQVVDGVFSVIDTAEIVTWFRPDIASDCQIALADDPGARYEILGEPENINRRNQFLKLKVKRVKGGA